MKKAIILGIFLSHQAFAFSDLNEQVSWFQGLFGNPTSSTQITKTEFNQGDTRPKAALKGVFYFGGSDAKRKLLSNDYRKLLCESGFSKIYSVYIKVDKNISCENNNLSYSYIGEARTNQKSGDRVYELLSGIHNIIQRDGAVPAIYLHCYYGVHASNTIAQMALMQFCGISKEQAHKNWHANDIYNSLGAEGTAKQMRKINNFEPYNEFAISKEQQAKVCY